MTYLIFDTELAANDALAQVEINYNCPVNGKSIYKMHKWDFVKKADNALKWYFSKPQARDWITQDEAMQGVAGYTEAKTLPEGFISIDLDVDININL